MNFVNRMLELIYLTKSEDDLVCYLSQISGCVICYSLKGKECKFNKPAFSVKVCPTKS